MNQIFLLALLLFSQLTHASIDRADYLKLTRALETTYADQVRSLGGKLKFTLKETTGSPNAFAAKRTDGTWEVTVMESLLTMEEQTKSSLGIILCHEIGHFLGGEPYVVGIQLTPAVRSRAPKKMSCEGQADYFATSECIKTLNRKLPDLFADNKGLLNPMMAGECNQNYENKEDINLCLETLVASYQTVLVYQKMLQQMNVPQSFFGKIDNDPTDRVLNSVGEYPSLDCRYETFLNGTMCSELSGNECHDRKWSRPACWFL